MPTRHLAQWCKGIPSPIWQRFESPLLFPNSVCMCVVQISISRLKKKKKKKKKFDSSSKRKLAFGLQYIIKLIRWEVMNRVAGIQERIMQYHYKLSYSLHACSLWGLFMLCIKKFFVELVIMLSVQVVLYLIYLKTKKIWWLCQCISKKKRKKIWWL